MISKRAEEIATQLVSSFMRHSNSTDCIREAIEALEKYGDERMEEAAQLVEDGWCEPKEFAKKMADKIRALREKNCKHPDFWFDRTIYSCRPNCDEQMHNVCMRCGKTECQIKAEEKLIKENKS